ncbi:MAG: hypothetical protein OIF32_00805 [Campylobacterales bacterium]|nr:hypothetical protein [Campylobacterales bacterium]
MKEDKTQLVKQWKELRSEFFNIFQEDRVKFDKKYSKHPLFSSVISHFDKSFRDVNQLADLEIEKFLQEN